MDVAGPNHGILQMGGDDLHVIAIEGDQLERLHTLDSGLGGATIAGN
jgi:hypothetical protein